MNTATAKDHSRFRSYRDKKKADPIWAVERVIGPANPFVHPQHWENLKGSWDLEEYERRVYAIDHRSPLATYPPWNRDEHLVADPARFTRDVSRDVLGIYQSYTVDGAWFELLAGHDPGILWNTTVFLRPVVWKRKQLVWLAVGEVVTRGTNQDEHAHTCKLYVQDKFGLNFDPERYDPDSGKQRTLVICDPHGNGEKRPEQDEYQSFRRHGFDIFPASADGKPITRRARIGMVRRLLRAANGDVRLRVVCDHARQPLAPTLVTSIEDQKLTEDGRAEVVRKDENDITHAATALGFALYPFERETISSWTQGRVELR